jgi:hypothetical protein
MKPLAKLSRGETKGSVTGSFYQFQNGKRAARAEGMPTPILGSQLGNCSSRAARSLSINQERLRQVEFGLPGNQASWILGENRSLV